MLHIGIEHDGIRIGERFAVSFHRTLRIPEDGTTYPLPPGLGRLPVVRARLRQDGLPIVIPLHQREAMWLGFSGAAWKPNAVKVIAGGINAVSGVPDDGRELRSPQDYLVCPEQLWLDGFNAGDGTIRQFVAMPLDLGYAAEAAFGHPERGGIRLIAFDPKPGRFPDEPPPPSDAPERLRGLRPALDRSARMGLSAGGRMHQKIYPDPYGLDIWDQAEHGAVELEIVNSERFRQLVGVEPPPTPIDAATYTAHGLPWFDLYDDSKGSVPPDEGRRLKSVAERDAERGLEGTGEGTVDVPSPQIRILDGSGRRGKGASRDTDRTRGD